MNLFRSILVSIAFASALFLAGATAVQAKDDCQRRIARADHKLHEAVEHHGWQSPQAEHWRHELTEARSYCWERNHRWWDEDERRWHNDRDWDDHDHDRDRDRH
jgi:hypothetical protein